MYTPTVRAMVQKYTWQQALHDKNLCSHCKNATWVTTLNSTFPNTGAMQDYLRFLTEGAAEQGEAEGYYRCYCRILHEYLGFSWFDKDEHPHIIDLCDSFEEYEPADQGKESEPRQRQLPRQTK